MRYRINGFDQIKKFYTDVFEGEKEIKSQHVSLYVFLINQNNRNNWVEWFKCPYDLAMQGACIGSKKTYYKCLNDLQDWGYIKYEKGINDFKAPRIKIEVLKCTSSDTATVPQCEPLLEPQGTPLPTHIYKHITNNLKLIIIEWDAIKKFIASLSDKNKKVEEVKPKNKPKTIDEREDDFRKSLWSIIQEKRSQYKSETYELKKFFDYWTEKAPKGRKMKFEKQSTFDPAKRLDTWFNNKKERETSKTSIGDHNIGVKYRNEDRSQFTEEALMKRMGMK